MSTQKNRSIGVHFIGIGGIGMSGLARYFLALSKGKKIDEKWLVSGSDAARSPLTQELVNEGIRLKIGHKTGNIPPITRLVIYNRAIPSTNPELIAAEKNKEMIVMPYSKALGRITENYFTIAITGSHGKSTTTALAGLSLMKAGLDPTILIGTKLKDLGGKNIRVGRGPYLVLEADDYGAAFLDYSPAVSIVTNIDREHMDFYKDFANVKRSFLKFLGNTREGGTLILNKDDVPLYSLKTKIATLAQKKDLRVIWHSTRIASSRVNKIKKAISIPGVHNISNAMAVMELGRVIAMPDSKILNALSSYKGAWRRMELKGNLNVPGEKIAVYDDYAHHPTEIKATLAAFREKFPRSPIICVFQPHQAKRLELLFNEFMQAFDGADIVFILPLYKVLGRDEKLPHDSEALVRAIEKRSKEKSVFYVRDPKKIKGLFEDAIKNIPSMVKEIVRPRSPIVIMMGAGDIADLTQKLLK
jgi:UDP-N-acetylmuramate--alanine ligase